MGNYLKPAMTSPITEVLRDIDTNHDRYQMYKDPIPDFDHSKWSDELEVEIPPYLASGNPHADRYVKYEEENELKDGPPGLTEDEKRMENIKKLLMTVDITEQRKRIVRQYLDWFKTILTSEQKKMTLETPLTDGDCEFLRVLSIPAVTGQIELNWQNFSDRREIHRYGVLFKRLFDFTDKGWDELQNILDAGR